MEGQSFESETLRSRHYSIHVHLRFDKHCFNSHEDLSSIKGGAEASDKTQELIISCKAYKYIHTLILTFLYSLRIEYLKGSLLGYLLG